MLSHTSIDRERSNEVRLIQKSEKKIPSLRDKLNVDNPKKKHQTPVQQIFFSIVSILAYINWLLTVFFFSNSVIYRRISSLQLKITQNTSPKTQKTKICTANFILERTTISIVCLYVFHRVAIVDHLVGFLLALSTLIVNFSYYLLRPPKPKEGRRDILYFMSLSRKVLYKLPRSLE